MVEEAAGISILEEGVRLFSAVVSSCVGGWDGEMLIRSRLQGWSPGLSKHGVGKRSWACVTAVW